MKICIVTTVPLTMRCFVLPTAAYLSKHGHDVTLICDDDGMFADEVPEGCRYLPVPMVRGLSVRGFSAIPKLKKIFRREHFDIVQYSTPNAAFYASTAAKAAKIPVRLYCQWGIRYMGFSGLFRRVFRWVEKRTAQNSTAIEPDCRGNLDYGVAEGLYPREKAHIVGYGSSVGVDLCRFDIAKRDLYRKDVRTRYGIGEEELVLGFSGRFCREKGMEELLSAYERLRAAKIPVRLLLVGDVPDVPDVSEDTVRILKNSPEIIKTGWVKEPAEYYAAMDVYILPSYREGFPTSVLEAEVMGLPVVITHLPYAGEAVTEGVNGFTVPPKDREALFKTLFGLLSSDDALKRCREMGEKAAAFARERFDTARLLPQILAERERLAAECKR